MKLWETLVAKVTSSDWEGASRGSDLSEVRHLNFRPLSHLLGNNREAVREGRKGTTDDRPHSRL